MNGARARKPTSCRRARERSVDELGRRVDGGREGETRTLSGREETIFLSG